MYKGIVYEVINRARSFMLMRNILSAFMKAKNIWYFRVLIPKRTLEMHT